MADKFVVEIETVKCSDESDCPPTAVANGGLHRLSDELVRFILAMPRENPDDVVPYYKRCTTLAEVMGEDWLEEQKRVYKEGAARDRRIYDEFVQFQNWVLQEWLEKGYVEVDEEYLANADEVDEEYFNKADEVDEYIRELADPDDPLHADFYVLYDPVEQARVLLSHMDTSD